MFNHLVVMSWVIQATIGFNYATQKYSFRFGSASPPSDFESCKVLSHIVSLLPCPTKQDIKQANIQNIDFGIGIQSI